MHLKPLISSLSILALIGLSVAAGADTYVIPFSDIRQAADDSGQSPETVIHDYLVGLIRDELDAAGFNVDGGLVFNEVPVDEITEIIRTDCDFLRPYQIHTDATTATITIDDSSSFTIRLDSIRSIQVSANLTGVIDTDTSAWVRWGQDILFVGDCVKINTDHGWIWLTLPFDIDLDLTLDLNPSYDDELVAIVVDKHATLSGQSQFTGGNLQHDFGTASLTDLVISAFEDELLDELSSKGQQAVADAITALNYRLDGLDENGVPDPTIQAFNGPSTFVLDVSDDDLVFIRDLLAEFGIPDLVLSMIEDRGIDILLELAILEGAERDAYLAALGAELSCAAILGNYETTLDAVPIYTLNEQLCEPADPETPNAGGFFADALCAQEIAFRPTDDFEFCTAQIGDQAKALLGNADAWAPDPNQPNDALPGIASRSWTALPSTRLDLGVVSLAGNYQPYVKQLNYKTIDNVPRGNGTCSLEMRVYKRDITEEGLKPVLALHGGTWQHRGFSFWGLEAGVSQLTDRGFIVFAPFYRLVGESDGNSECNGVSWREVTEDAESALDWVIAHGAALGAGSGPVSVTGQSAGAHLAAWLAAHRPEDVRKGLLFYGPLDALDFLEGAVPIGGPYDAYRGFGLTALTRFFGATNGMAELRLGQINFAGLSASQLAADWPTIIPNSAFNLTQIDPLAPPIYAARCAAATQTDLSAINLAAPPTVLLDCLKQDLSDFVVRNSFNHLLSNDTVPIFALHGSADTIVPHDQSVNLCAAIDGSAFPLDVTDPLTVYFCGASSQAQIVKDADHALELGVCIDPLCPAGEPGSATREATVAALNAAYSWLMEDPPDIRDSDGDGLANYLDDDDDNDGTPDEADAFPLDPSESLDSDADGIGNNADTDDDNDTIADATDNCPLHANANQVDSNGDGFGDTCDPPFARIATLPDINANGTPDLALLRPDESSGIYRAQLRDGASGALIGLVGFDTDPVVSMRIIPDINNNGSPDIAVLATTPSGQVRIQIRDSSSGESVNNIFYSDNFAPVDMVVMPDTDGNGTVELAVLGVNVFGNVRIQAKDAVTDAATSTTYYGNTAMPIDLAIVPNLAGGGAHGIVMHGRVVSSGQGRAQLRAATSGEFLGNLFFGATYAPMRLAIIDDLSGDGIPDVAQLARRPDSAAVRVQIRASSNGALISNAFAGTVDFPIEVVGIGDANGNSTPDLAILVQQPDGSAKIIVRDGGSGAFIRNIFVGGLERPQSMAIIGDLDASGDPELAILGNGMSTPRVAIYDSIGAAHVSSIEFP